MIRVKPTDSAGFNMDFNEILRFAVEKGASDLHVQTDAPPLLRISGDMCRMDMEPATDEQTKDWIASILPQASGDSGMQTFDQHILKMHLAGLVSVTEALRWASNSEALSMKIRMSRYKKKKNE